MYNVCYRVSSLIHSSMGVVTPFNSKQYSTDVMKNVQINLPIRAEIDVDLIDNKVAAKVEPLDQQNKYNLFEFSTKPSTANFNILQLIQNPNEVSNANSITVHARQPNQVQWILLIKSSM